MRAPGRSEPAAAAIEEASKKLSNWGRWGKDDERGALNHQTVEHRVLISLEWTTSFTLRFDVLRRGDEVLSEIQSTWCCLDAASLRPARLARDIVARFLPKDPA